MTDIDPDSDEPKKAKKRRIPKPMTYERLEYRAFAHIGRFACSEEELRRVLVRAVRRNARFHPLEDDKAAEAEAWIEQIMTKLGEMALLDDSAYAALKVRSGHRQGKGMRAMRFDLGRRGVGDDEIEDGVRQLSEEEGYETPADADLIAAIDFVRRRKLGPLRPDENLRQETRNKDMQALARRGFGLDIIRKIMDARDESELDLLRQSVVQNM